MINKAIRHCSFESVNELRESDIDWDGEITSVTRDVEPMAPRKPNDSAAEIDVEKLSFVTRNVLGILGTVPAAHRLYAMIVVLVGLGVGYVLWQRV